jgi:hypothetical protein
MIGGAPDMIVKWSLADSRIIRRAASSGPLRGPPGAHSSVPEGLVQSPPGNEGWVTFPSGFP